MAISEYEDTEMESFPLNGMTVPLIRLTTVDLPPDAGVKVGEQAYQYDRSYPIKGYSAVLPGYLKQQLAAGKQALLIERPTRLYVYLS